MCGRMSASWRCNGFNCFEITGGGVHDWLDPLMCSRVPRKTGKVGLTYFLNDLGNIKGEATIANLEDGRVWYGSAAAAELHDMDWLAERLPADGAIRMESLTNAHTVLVVAGPKSRDVLRAAAPRTDWSAEAFPWLSVRRVRIGHIEAQALSVSYSGELSWEIHVPLEQSAGAFEIIWRAGAPHGVKPFGRRTMDSLRMEKGHRHWKADLIAEFNPLESGLERFVDFEKDFVGKQALRRMQEAGPRRVFVTLEVRCDEAVAHPGDSVLCDGAVCGAVTSAAWGHRIGKNLAMAFVDPANAQSNGDLGIEMLGRVYPAVVIEPRQYDAAKERVRS